MKKVINISSNGIKQAIDDLVNENELLQDKVYKQNEEIERLNNIINTAIKLINETKGYYHDGVDEELLDILKESSKL